jgi:hypothetical protein
MLLFPIPKKYYKLVLLTLADAIRNEEAEKTASSTGTVHPVVQIAESNVQKIPNAVDLQVANPQPGRQGGSAWTLPELSRLRSLLRANSAALTMLNLTATRPGQPVTFTDICKAAQRTPYGARSDIGGLTKLCRNHIGHTELPVTWEKSMAGDGEALYTMSQEMAALWNRTL